jgi:hypothetical protein
MSLFKRNDSSYWWVRFIYNGRRIQHSTGTADQAKAQEYHDKLKASLWDQERLGVKPRRTWNEAVVKYLAETSHKASQSDDRTHLRWVDRFLNGVMLDRIDPRVAGPDHDGAQVRGPHVRASTRARGEVATIGIRAMKL